MRIPFIDTSAAAHPLLRSPRARVVLVATPAVTAMAAIFSAASPSLAVGIVLSAAAGVIIASSLFIAVGAVAREVADERVLLAQTLEDEHWHARAQRLSPQHHRNGRLYADWYFRLRLQEEIERARRYNVPFTLLIAKRPAREARGNADDWVKTEVEQYLRRTDLPAVLRDGSLGVILHHTAHFSAVRSRLTETLSSAQAAVGFAAFPKDGADVSSLLRAADSAAEEDRRERLARPLQNDHLAA